jgi:pimeloyl-ACP methyl ester carboxylesterase
MDDVAALIDASGAREVLLIAHDWGAIIAWYFAMRRVRPLVGLVIMNVPHPGASERAFRRPRQLLRSWYAMFFQLPVLPERIMVARKARAVSRAFAATACHPERFPESILDRYRTEALRPGASTGMINYYRAFFRGGGAGRQRQLGTPQIDVRTLFIWGEQDMALTKATSEGTEAFVRDLVVRYLPDASHWVQQDAPETVNAMLSAWLAGEKPPFAEAGS